MPAIAPPPASFCARFQVAKFEPGLFQGLAYGGRDGCLGVLSLSRYRAPLADEPSARAAHQKHSSGVVCPL